MTRIVSGALFIAVLLAPSVAWSVTVSLFASKDNSIFQSDSTASNGGGPGIFVGLSNTSQSNTLRRGLLEFDVAAQVPNGATITDVHLTMYLGQASQISGNQTIELHRLTADWGEGTAGSPPHGISGTGSGAPAAPGDATWSSRFHEQATWTAPGGDYIPAISASKVVGTTLQTAYTWDSTPTLVSDVQGWLDNPASNFGWLLKNANESQSQTVKAFYSRDATEINNANGDPLPEGWNPSLEITFTMGSEPSGDYSDNGFVDSADYVVWRKTLGQSAFPAGGGADGYQDGIINGSDYAYWRTRFGNPVNELGNGFAVPEPGMGLLLIVAGPLAFCRKRR